MESIGFLDSIRVGFIRRIASNSSTAYQIGVYRRVALNTVFLIGTGTGGGGESTPVTVPTTGQIYPRAINI